jgi:hypothetical protein
MAVIEAPFSRYKRNNYLIIMGILLAAAVIFGYDGYLSRFEWSMRHDFYRMHVIDNGGVPDSDMKFNMYSPPFFLAGAIVLLVRFFMVKGKKLTADETALHIDTLAIPYDSMERINKTYFDKKGYFTLTYKDSQQQMREVTLSDRNYDNLPALLDTLVSKIS